MLGIRQAVACKLVASPAQFVAEKLFDSLMTAGVLGAIIAVWSTSRGAAISS